MGFPEPLRTDLTVRRDLPPEEILGFLGDLWRDPEGSDVGLMFADWLEDHGDARCQPVRWSLQREAVFTEEVRNAYRDRMSEWWLRHGRAWIGPIAQNVLTFWNHGCLSSRIEASYVPEEGPISTNQRIRSLRQSPWVARVELGHARSPSLLNELSPHLRALVLRACALADLGGLSRLPGLRQLTLQEFMPARLELADLPVVERVEIVVPDQLRFIALLELPNLHRVEFQDAAWIEEVHIERTPELTHLDLGTLPALRGLVLRELPRLERLTLPAGYSGPITLEHCSALPPQQLDGYLRRLVR